MSKFLLPYKFKYWGAIMFPIGLLCWYLGQKQFFNHFLHSVHFIQPGLKIILSISFFSLLFGLYFLIFSKEKNEDEYISKIRLESFHFATLLQFTFLLVVFILMYLLKGEPKHGSGHTQFFLVSIFILWLSYITRFNYIVLKNKINSGK